VGTSAIFSIVSGLVIGRPQHPGRRGLRWSSRFGWGLGPPASTSRHRFRLRRPATTASFWRAPGSKTTPGKVLRVRDRGRSGAGQSTGAGV